jgi:hypothetical protein
MKLWLGFVAGFVFGSVSLFAQTPLLDFGAIPDIQQRGEISQWWIEKEIRNGRNPYAPSNPCQ